MRHELHLKSAAECGAVAVLAGTAPDASVVDLACVLQPLTWVMTWMLAHALPLQRLVGAAKMRLYSWAFKQYARLILTSTPCLLMAP
jgi:hypothetical protein